MMVQAADRWKRIAHAALRRAVGAIGEPEEVHRDLQAAPDPVTRYLAGLLEEGAGFIQREYQRETVLTVGRFAVWWLDKDAAYRDLRDWLVMSVRTDAVLGKGVTPPVKPPHQWHVNLFAQVEAEAQLSRATGSVPEDRITAHEAAFFAQPPPGDGE